MIALWICTIAFTLPVRGADGITDAPDSCVPQSSGSLRQELLDLVKRNLHSKSAKAFKLVVKQLCAGELYGGALIFVEPTQKAKSKNAKTVSAAYVLFRNNEKSEWEIFEFEHGEQGRSPVRDWFKKYEKEKNLSSTLAALGLSDNAEAP